MLLELELLFELLIAELLEIMLLEREDGMPPKLFCDGLDSFELPQPLTPNNEKIEIKAIAGAKLGLPSVGLNIMHSFVIHL